MTLTIRWRFRAVVAVWASNSPISFVLLGPFILQNFYFSSKPTIFSQRRPRPSPRTPPDGPERLPPSMALRRRWRVSGARDVASQAGEFEWHTKTTGGGSPSHEILGQHGAKHWLAIV